MWITYQWSYFTNRTNIVNPWALCRVPHKGVVLLSFSWGQDAEMNITHCLDFPEFYSLFFSPSSPVPPICFTLVYLFMIKCWRAPCVLELCKIERYPLSLSFILTRGKVVLFSLSILFSLRRHKPLRRKTLPPQSKRRKDGIAATTSSDV